MNVERGIELSLAYGLALASAATASLYGLMSASGPYGIVKGIGLFGVAFVGCHGPAWIVKAKQRLGWSGAGFGAVVTAICLVTTLWGGLGTNAGGGSNLRAERAKANTTIADNRAELSRLLGERDALPVFSPTTQEAVAAAQSAVESAERARKAECGNGDPKQRGNNCRARETDETARRAVLATALSNRAVTAQAEKLDGELATVRQRLARGPGTTDVDPQASAFSQLTGVSVDTAIALNAFWLSLAFELGAMFTMLIAYSHTAPSPPVQQPTPEPVQDQRNLSEATENRRVRTIGGVELIKPPRPLATGDVRRFMLACLPRARGQEVTWGATYARYQRWCSEQSPALAPLTLTAFGAEFKAACDRAKVRTRQKGSKLYCLDVQLVA